MLLKEIIIQNYRKFTDTTFSLDDDITLLAGANNSGKTSLIDLLCGILGNNRVHYSVTNIPVTLAKAWCDQVYPIFSECFHAGLEKEKTISEIVKKIIPSEQE